VDRPADRISSSRLWSSARRSPRRELAIAGALWLLGVAPARADWYLSPFIGLKFGGDTTLVELEPGAAARKKLTYGGNVMWLGDGLLGVEADLGIVPDYFKGDLINVAPPGTPPRYIPLVQSSRLTTLMGNAVLAAPRSWTRDSLRPYVSGGFGLVRARRTDYGDVFAVTRNLGGFNIGGGAFGFITRRTGVRWDLRYVRGSGTSGDGNTFGSARLHIWRATMGVVLRY
jgi:hypothetical protein